MLSVVLVLLNIHIGYYTALFPITAEPTSLSILHAKETARSKFGHCLRCDHSQPGFPTSSSVAVLYRSSCLCLTGRRFRGSSGRYLCEVRCDCKWTQKTYYGSIYTCPLTSVHLHTHALLCRGFCCVLVLAYLRLYKLAYVRLWILAA